MTGTITVKEAAQVLNVDQQTVRVWLQQGLVSWGQAIKVKGSTQFNYVIYKIPFQNLTGYPDALERDGVDSLDRLQNTLQKTYEIVDEARTEHGDFDEIGKAVQTGLDEVSELIRAYRQG